jgi:hypothetical protein
MACVAGIARRAGMRSNASDQSAQGGVKRRLQFI